MGGYIKADYANRGDTSLRLFRGGLQSDLTTPKRPTNDRYWPKAAAELQNSRVAAIGKSRHLEMFPR